MDMFGENFRGIHALALLSRSRGWTLEKLQAAAFDSFQPGFAVLIPSLLALSLSIVGLPGAHSRAEAAVAAAAAPAGNPHARQARAKGKKKRPRPATTMRFRPAYERSCGS